MPQTTFWRSDRNLSSLSDSSGAVLIEFAFTLPLLVLLILGIFDFALMFQRQQVVSNAAREGARMRILPGYSEADLDSRVKEFLTSGGIPVSEVPADPAVSTPVLVEPAGGGTPYWAMKVTVKLSDYRFRFLRPFVDLTVPVESTVQMRVENAAVVN